MCLTIWCWLISEGVELLRVVAWPLAFGAFAWYFREPIAERIAKLLKVGVAGLAQAEFGPPDSYKVEFPELTARPAVGPEAPNPEDEGEPPAIAKPPLLPAHTSDLREQELMTLPELTEAAPTVAINKAWALVSGEAVGAARRAGATFVPVLNQIPAPAVESELVARRVIDDGTMQILRRLRDINVRVMDGKEKATVPSAAAYVVTATSLFKALRKWKPAQGGNAAPGK